MRSSTIFKSWVTLLILFVIGIGNAWGTEVTYTITSTSAVSKTGTEPTGATAKYSSTYATKEQLTNSNSMTLTLSGFDSYKITGLTLSMKSNAKSGAGYMEAKVGSTPIATIGSSSAGFAFNNNSWNNAYSTTYVPITPTVTPTTVGSGESVSITIGCTANSLYCQSFTITYEEESAPALSTPTNLSTSNITYNSVTLSWDKVENASRYKLEYKKDGATAWIEATPAPNNNSYTLNNLESETEYNWQVSAVPNSTSYKNSAAASGINFITSAFIPTAGTYDIVPNNSFWGIEQNGSQSVKTNTTFGPASKYGVKMSMNTGTSTNSYINETHTRAYNGYTVSLTAPTGFTLTKIVFTGNNWAAPLCNVGTMDEKSWTGNANEVAFSFTGTSYMENIAVTYGDASTISIPTPTFNIAAGTYTENQIVKISNYSSNYLYAYTTDGTAPSFNDELNITNGTEYDDNAGIEITNSCTLRVIATDEDGNTSSVASAEYIINKPQVFSSLEELVAADITSGTIVTVSFSNIPIKSIFVTNTNYRNGIYLDIQKEGKDIEIYYHNVPEDWAIGGTVSGTITCPWKLYNSTWELAPDASTWDWNYLTYTAPAAEKALTAIAVSGTPAKTEYTAGQSFDPTGLIVTGTYSDNSKDAITENIVWTITPATLTEGTTSVTVIATVGEISSEAFTVTGLSVSSEPAYYSFTYNFNDKNAYPEGFPTSGTNVSEAQTFTISGHDIVINAPNSYYVINNGTDASRALFFGKSVTNNGTPTEGTAYLGFPGLANKKLVKVVATTSAGCAKDAKVNIFDSEWNAKSEAITTLGSQKQELTYVLSETAVNTEYRLSTATSGKNLQFDHITLYYETTNHLTSISISGQPTHKKYWEGESLSTKGLTVIGHYNDETEEEITEGITWTFSPETLSAGTTSCQVTATVGSLTSAVYTVNDLIVKAPISAPTITVIGDAPYYNTTQVTIRIDETAVGFYYTTDGSDPTDSNTATDVMESSATIEISETSTIKAIAYDNDMDLSEVSEEEITIGTLIEGLANLKEKSNGNYYLNLNNAIITYVYGKNAYIEDENGGYLIYCENHGFVAGDKLNGIYQVSTIMYNGKHQISSIESITGTKTQDAEIPVTTLTIEELADDAIELYESMRIQVVDARVSTGISSNNRTGEISDGTNTYAIYAGVNGITAETGAIVTIVGYLSYQNENQDLVIWEQSDITATSVPQYTISIDNTITNGTVTASASSAEAGTKITLIATPNDGYQFVSWNVKDASNTVIEVIEDKFEMPASNVTVSATFEEKLPDNVAVVTINIEKLTNPHSTTAITYGTYKWKDGNIEGVYNGASSTSNTSLQFNYDASKAQSYRDRQGVYNAIAIPGKITSIKMTTQSGTERNWKAFVSSSQIDPNNYSSAFNLGEKKVTTGGTTWAVESGNYKYFYLNYTVGSASYIEDIVITYQKSDEPDATVNGIRISGTPEDLYIGDDFTHNGITVTADWSDGSTSDVTSFCEYSGYDMNSIGNQTITVTYQEATTTYEVNIKKKPSSITIADISLGVGSNATITATTTPADATLTYTITSGGDKISMDGNVITGLAVGSAKVQASYDGNDIYENNSITFNVEVVATDDPTISLTGFSTISGDLDENISYSAAKGSSGTTPMIPTGTSAIRLYQGGGYFTLTAKEDITITKAVITTSKTYSYTKIGVAYGDDSAPSTGKTVNGGEDFTASEKCQKVSFYCLGTDKDHRLEIAAVKVWYTIGIEQLTSITIDGDYQKEFLQNKEYNREGLVVTAHYTSGATKDVTNDATFSVPEMKIPGIKTINVSYTEGNITRSASYEISISLPSYSLFYESFDTNNGTGGNDNRWNGSIALSDVEKDNSNLTLTAAKGADMCVKLGSSSTIGSARIKGIQYSGMVRLSFKAGSWSGDKTTININKNDTEISTIKLDDSSWKECIDTLDFNTGDIIEISSSVSGKRFFLDEIYVNKIEKTRQSSANLQGWKTFYDEKLDYQIDENTSIFIAKEKSNGSSISLMPIEGNIIPKNTPVLLHTEADDYRMTLKAVANSSESDFSNNAFKVAESDGTIDGAYILAYTKANGLAFYNYKGSLDKGDVYLVPTFTSSESASSLRLSIEEHTTGINEMNGFTKMENLYNITGQKTNEAKGLLIRNGKVILVK